MKQTTMTTRRRIAAVAAAAWLAGWGAPAAATVLLFDQNRFGQPLQPGVVGGPLAPGYGSRVDAAFMAVPNGGFTYGDAGEGFTPNVSVDIFATGASAADSRIRLWQTGYGDLVNAIFAEGPGTQGAPEMFVHLQADAGYRVDLYGFDLAGFGRDYTIAGVEVLAGLQPLFSVRDLLVEGDASGPGHTHLDFGGPLSAGELLIRIDLSNLAPGIQDNIGLDSLRFGQSPPPPTAVPEPSVLALLAAGLLALGVQRPGRRRRAEPVREATTARWAAA